MSAPAPIRRTRRVTRVGPVSVRVSRRALGAGIAIASLIAVLVVVGSMIGDYPMSFGQTVQSLFGIGDDPLARYFVQEQRLPRVAATVLVGAALGMSGAIFQNLSGNPLGSPDVIGFTVGASSGAILQIIIFDSGPATTALGAIVGGFGTAALVYVLTWRGGIAGFRLVLVGIGISAILHAINTLLIERASLSAAQNAQQWLAGSFHATTWAESVLIAVALAILGPSALALSRPLGAMMLGDDTALGLGVRLEQVRLALVLVGVALVSLATAAAGPIAFVALAAPQLARRLTGTRGVGIAGAALMGAALVLASDIIAQRIFAPKEIAVGVVTGSLGGVYLIWILAREWRRGA
ncbi:MAG: FecCD family ABC transporter permease [Cumulibacter sp.]